MTECMPISAPPTTYALDRPGTSGRSIGPELKILDDEGNVLPPGPHRGIGNICVRGCPLFAGYENNNQANESSFLNGGFFNTGDLGWMDADGYLCESINRSLITTLSALVPKQTLRSACGAHPAHILHRARTNRSRRSSMDRAARPSVRAESSDPFS